MTGRAPTITFRCRAILRDKIKASASAAGRSVSEEIETQLQRAYERDELRQIIRDEIRAALDIKDARAIGMSVAAQEQRDFGPRDALIGGSQWTDEERDRFRAQADRRAASLSALAEMDAPLIGAPETFHHPV